MKCECFTHITDLLDYLQNNLLIAYYCGFNIMEPLPSYWTLDRFINKIDHSILQKLMHSQVLDLASKGIIDTSFISLDSTPVAANTSHNNPKSFKKNKFSKDHHPKSDKDCGLGVHTASNQVNERKFEYYWGCKDHVLVDCITGLFNSAQNLNTIAHISLLAVAIATVNSKLNYSYRSLKSLKRLA